MRAKRREYVVSTTRFYAVARERVLQSWTRAEHLAHWFGPRGFTVHSVEADPRPGGAFRLIMRAPDGRDYRVRGGFREVVPPERLVIDCRADAERGLLAARVASIEALRAHRAAIADLFRALGG